MTEVIQTPCELPLIGSTLRRSSVGLADLVRLWLGAGLSPDVAAAMLGFEATTTEELPASELALSPRPGPRGVTMEQRAASTELDETPTAPLPLWRAFGPDIQGGLDSDADEPEPLRNARALRQIGAVSHAMLRPASLSPASRLGPALKRLLQVERLGSRIDERKLVQELSQCRALRRLPWRTGRVWPARLQVYWDQSEPLLGLLYDQLQIVRWLRRWRGAAGLEEIIVDERFGVWQPARGERTPPRSPDAGTTLFALSDLGSLNDELERRALWQGIGRRAQRAGARACVLAPSPAARWNPPPGAPWSALEWERGRRLVGRRSTISVSETLRVAPGEIDAARRSERVERLLTLLSPTIRIEPALLRAVRGLLPRSAADIGTELDVWMDPRIAIRCAEGIALRPESAVPLRLAFAKLEEAERLAVRDLILRHHGHLSPLIVTEELAASGDPAAAETLWGYAKRLQERGGVFDPFEVDFIAQWESRQSEDAWQHDPVVAATWALVHRAGNKFDKELPTGLSMKSVAWALGTRPSVRWLSLWQYGSKLYPTIFPAREAPEANARGSLLAELPFRHPQLQFRFELPNGERVDSLVAADDLKPLELPALLARAPDADGLSVEERSPRVQVESDLGLVELAPLELPDWVDALERDAQGLWVRVSLRGELQRLLWPTWADQLEQDEYGIVGQLRLAPGVMLRLRWIPPGRFLMGSAEDERGRYEDEGPQHWVTLTQGYWLGEAPVTQAEWQAVMRENPSRFKEEDSLARPVEQVSWEDCQAFCQRLQARFPGLSARLPSEAEWEYACRARTTSAYNDGSPCTVPQGKDPALEKLGWYRENSGQQTQAVRGKRPNAWGLYDLHGNVYEWCEDRWADYYEAGEQRDPQGPAEGDERVIRGGSWYSWASNCRSAHRNGRRPSERDFDLGLRVAAGQPLSGAEPRRAERARARGGQVAGGPPAPSEASAPAERVPTPDSTDKPRSKWKFWKR